MREFIDRIGFSGQRKIICLEFRLLDNSHISRNIISFFYIDDISWHQFFGTFFYHYAVPVDLGIGVKHLLE